MIERRNYLKVKEHLKYLGEVLQLAPVSVGRYRFYLRHLLLWADDQDLRMAQSIRPTLPVYLASLPGKNARGVLAGASQKKILDSSKRFFHWAKTTYQREMNNLPDAWIDTLRLPRHPQLSVENVFVTMEEIQKLLAIPVPENNLVILRDQAAAAMLFLSGMRAGAFTTLPISAVDLEYLTIHQWPELGVHTKNNKKATTFLLNIPELLVAVRRWDDCVRSSLPESRPWYAPLTHVWGEQSLSIQKPGSTRSQTLQKRLRRLFALADIPFKSPHKFRHGHAVYGLLHARTMADYKAVSMNLMHDSIEITDNTYAPMVSSDVRDRIAGLSDKACSMPEDGIPLADGELESYLNGLSRENQKRALVFIAGRLAQ